VDAELVNKIVEQVLVAMGQTPIAAGGSAPKPLAASRDSSTAATAPGKPAAAQAPAAAPKTASAPAGASTQRKVFLTADMLRQRLAGSTNGQAKLIELDGFEFLTPAAEDFAADAHVVVQRRPQPLIAAPQAAANPASAPVESRAATGQADRPPGPAKLPGYGLVTARLSDAAATAVRAASQGGLKLEDWNRKGCWLRDSRSMCEAVAAGTLAGGIVLAPRAADAMVLTAKHRSIRPVQGTRPESVRNALRHFDANVLVIEHTCCTFHEMREMIRLFVSARPARESSDFTDALMRHVGEVEAS